MMIPLAHKIRPTTFQDVIGQEHLISSTGILTKMLEKKEFLSFILYGPPGTGKTTIATIFANESKLDFYFFNASTDNKQKLKDIIDTTVYHNILLIVDEIHRMNKDIQDYLLPFIENGKVIVIGITTLNPYISVNLALRSRMNLYEIYSITDENIKIALKNALKHLDKDLSITDEALNLITIYSNNELRTAYNILQSASILLEDNDIIKPNHIRNVLGKKQLNLDYKEEHFYDLLSALQKSIRGSDVDASLHYLARLLILEDLKSIQRRLLVISYEDIGLANPLLQTKTYNAIKAVDIIGMPEARIILANIVIELALSPKSNTALIAIDKALNDLENESDITIPDHALNRKINLDKSIYHYPHDDINSINAQTYLPNNIKDKNYYIPKFESHYEKALGLRLEEIDKIKNKKR